MGGLNQVDRLRHGGVEAALRYATGDESGLKVLPGVLADRIREATTKKHKEASHGA